MIKVSLTFIAHKFFHQFSLTLLIFLGFNVWNIAHCGISFAQTSPLITGELPPPDINPMNDVASDEGEMIDTIPYFESTPATSESEPVQQEYNFQAPQPNYSSIPTSVPGSYSSHPADKLVEFYRVEVITEEVLKEDQSLLLKVKQIEPFAYIQSKEGEGIIYAGLFQEQLEAQQRVQQLTNQGLSARIVPINYSVSSSYDIPVQQ